MSFTSVLQKIGHDIASIFEKSAPIIAEIQAVATPFENIFAPGLSSIINKTLTAIYNTEALAAAAGNQNGSGAVKLAAVVGTIAPQIAPDLAAMGVSAPTSTEYTNFINALVSAANAFQIMQVSPVTTNVPTPVATIAPPTGAVVK